jgi:3',5'-cyclic AMP phosphodiesterase CpdA
MSVILHLSDLHLGKDQPWERATDDKSEFVPKGENSRLAVMETALAAVKQHLVTSDLELDSVVIGGDITTGYDEEGFTRFSSLLEGLKLVGDVDRIIAVPGNHDVDRESDPGTEQKYARFLKFTREAGFRTPFCDGVDTIEAADARPILDLEDCVIAAINSANWCGVPVQTGDTTHRYDAARVSETQLEYLTDQLRDHEIDGKVRIGVLHHHLLPVTEDEETKPFESFTNLARLRSWISHHKFHAVLHGHKHRPVITWDHVYDFEDHLQPATRVLVISAPTPTTWGAPVCRLIRIGEAAGRKVVRGAPRLLVDTVNAERHERRIEPTTAAVDLHEPRVPPAALIAIDADTADAAYERLLSELEKRPGRLLNVTCVVRDPESASRLPTNFVGKPENPEQWFEDAVSWWQSPAPLLIAAGDAPFNHGERLYATGNATGELDAAAKLLGSTKAMVFLTTGGELRNRPAPAFVAIQLVLASDEAGDRLDCIGYFRKQDLTLWWPVNVAELRAIQKRVLDLGPERPVRAGHLVTIAAEAIHDNVMPRLSGTTVDRAVDLRPELLMKMAYAAAHGPSDPTDATQRDEINALWAKTFKDIGRLTDGDVEDFPSLGIARLLDHLRVFREVGGRENVSLLIKRLEAVYDRAHRAKSTSKTGSERREFAGELFDLIGAVLDAVEESLAKCGASAPGVRMGDDVTDVRYDCDAS